MKTIAAGKFKAQCLSLLDEVKESHEVFLVTKHGKAVAQVSPVMRKEVKAGMRLKGSILRQGDIVSPIGDDWQADQ